MLERVIGVSAAAQVSFALVPASMRPDGTPIDEFTISGVPGSILVQGTTASALTQGAGWYLKYVAHADLMLRGSMPVLPSILPGPGTPIHQTATVPHRYAFNDTHDSYTDPNLPWEGWENEIDLLALHGINEILVTVGTDAVYYQFMQRYGYTTAELRSWIPDPAHQLGWALGTMSGGEFPITDAMLQKRAQLGRRIADRARELGITPVFPGYWGTVPTDFAARNPGADVVAQDTWVGYQRPGWLNPATPMFQRVAADYYATSAQVLGSSAMYKMDPLHEGGLVGDVDLAQAGTAIQSALQTAHPGATWVIIAWLANPSADLLAGITDKAHLLLLATEADAYPTWDSALRWPGVPYAFGSIYDYGGRTIVGANASTIVKRWFGDLNGPNAANLRGVALFPEAWTANPAVAELLSELPWQSAPIDLAGWLGAYAIGRYGRADPHALAAWSMFATTAYAAPPNGIAEANDSVFDAQPKLTAGGATCCYYERMRYSGPDFEKAWRELLAAAPGVTQLRAYQFDLTDFTRQVIVNRARVLLPMIRRAYDRRDAAQFTSLTARWLNLLDLADQVEGTNAAFMLGPHLDNARANGSTPDEQSHLVRNALNLITNWGTRAGYDAGLYDYANRDWNCFTRTYYKARWARFFDALGQQLGSSVMPPIDWYQMGEDFANGAHTDCASIPSGDIVQIAQQVRSVLDAGPEASVVPDGWSSYAENDAVFGFDGTHYAISSAGADLWQNVNRFGALYQRGAMRDGITVTAHLASWVSEANRPWARAGLMVGSDLVDAKPGGFVNIAITPGNGCVFSWASNPAAGLTSYTATSAVGNPVWIRLSRIGNTYVGSCSVDGSSWTIAGSAVPGGLTANADVGMFASAANGGGSDRAYATFDQWQVSDGGASGDTALAVEYVHAQFAHHFVTAITDEIAKLDAGVFQGWARTGLGFKVHTSSGVGRVPVCRFFTTAFPPTSSHFYAPRGLGCEGAQANPDWLYEGEVFFTALPTADGACPAGDLPIYRLYNDGQGGAPNHRFTIDPAVRAQMLQSGYIAEGTGIGVGMCAGR